MRKKSVLIIIFLGLVIGGYLMIKNTIGDFVPAALPVAQGNSTTNSGLTLPSNFKINFYANNLGDVRDLEFSPDGTLLASQTANGTIIALPSKKIILSGLQNPHGIAFYKNKLYVAEETRLSRFNFDEKKLIATLDKVLFTIPPGSRHFTRSIVFDAKGNLFLSVGSTCDTCQEPNPWYASVIITNANGDNPQVFATGLRNSVFLTINSKTNEVWATEMGRDYLGDNIPPDEINIVRKANNYGWPNCYADKIPDTSFNLQADCKNTTSPIYQIQAHSAPLGLTFINSFQFPKSWQGDLLVAYHGSWNRSVPTGYKIVHMKVNGNQILGEEDFLTGFLQGNQVIGRPVDLVFDKLGNLYVSDDKAGVVYVVSKK